MAGAADKAQSWTYAEEVVAEPPAAAAARERAAELGVPAVSVGVGALLRAVAAASSARHVVEIGTGAGVSGVWLLAGMPSDGVLTTIDVDVEYQRSARAAFTQAGVPASRTRTIAGRALEVLPRLANGSYDLVVLDGEVAELSDLLVQATRLLRSGGTLAIPHALWFDRVADPARRDPETVAMREVVRTLAEDEGWLTALVPSGTGVLLAVRR
ncbi:MAG TPA: methyltransferase [Micrococcales bacterium]|uniref:O-methyltransferase n=1 Tax=Miniimonas arenae TaxID=676201 RepID=A0A5C5BBQ4_9MICO|nr:MULTISPECIES: O-methyltransferase [Miniimonas]TNU73492.1 O-methyltransferase [Miniimonas arenae]HCX85137.1 methyltransferase [Micrococcales bacterium]